MLHEITLEQIGSLRLERDRPLVICDVDEVVVHFTRDFEDYLRGMGMWLDAASLALDGNIKWLAGNAPVPRHAVGEAVDRFFVDRTLHQRPIDGAAESLRRLGAESQLVFLSNLPHTSGDDRRRNLQNLGLDHPLVTNSGPKGPAIRRIAALTDGPCVFIDDSPGFIASAYEHAPDVHLVHFMHDERFARHVTPFGYLSLFTGRWDEAEPHVRQLIRG